jgi:uncharacterized protein (TIGR02466 family)
MRIESFDVFPTLIMCFDLSDHPAKERVLTLMQNSKKGWHKLVEGGSSTYDTSIVSKFLSNTLITDFRATIEECVGDFCETAGIKKPKITNSWVNEMGPGSRVTRHRHELSAVSGAYYPTWNEANANLTFKNPLSIYKMAELHEGETMYNTSDIEIPGAAGKLILFPSFLEHYTNENQSSNRLVMSFNTAC